MTHRLAAFVSLLLLVTLLPGTASAQEVILLDVDAAAADPVQRSIVNAQLTFDSADSVLIGRADLFADNLASGAAQGIGDQPLLLTDGDELDARVLDELERLGADSVQILGGTAAITAAVAEELGDNGIATSRLSGATRIETAIDVAETVDSETVIVARGFAAGADETQAFADSLAAGALAAANGWPLVFTQTEVLTAATREHIAAAGYTRAVVIGGTSAIGDAVVTELEGMVDDVDRIAGANRFETAVAIANERGFADAADAGLTVVIDGQGEDAWTDGFTLAALAGRENAPIVLGNSATDTLPEATADFLTGAAFAQATAAPLDEDVTIICGDTLPDDGTSDQCDEAGDAVGATDRVVFEGSEGPMPEPFGVTVSPTTVQQGGTLTVAVTGLEAETTITVNGCGIAINQTFTLAQIGDDQAVSVAGTVPTGQALGTCSVQVRVQSPTGTDRYNEATTITVIAPTGGGTALTARPELTSATINQTVTPAQATVARPEGTYVRFTFDAALAAVNMANNFLIYAADHTRYLPESATLLSGNTVVEARYVMNGGPTLSDTQNARKLTVAAVREGAVITTGGLVNPPASTRIGSAQNISSGGAGQTAAPDLTTVTRIATAAAANMVVADFTFDETAYVVDAAGAGFSLLLVNSAVVACAGPVDNVAAGGGTAPGGSGTTRVTVQCPDMGGGIAVTTANVSRGVVQPDTVSDAAADSHTGLTANGNGNPLAADDVSNSGLTSGPDLTAVAFDPESVAGVDRVGFTFDENIDAASVIAADGPFFAVYDVDGNEIPGQNAAITVSGAQLIVTFADGDLALAVGGSVQAGTVNGQNSGLANLDAEDEVTNVTTSITPGQTDGPQLVSAQIEQAPGFDPTGFLFTFDEAIANDVDANFAVFRANGTKFTATACATTAVTTQVRCTAFGATPVAQLSNAVVATAEEGAVTDAVAADLSIPGAAAL